MTQPTMTQPTMTQSDGARDFDPYLGRWLLHNKKLRDVFDPDCTEWIEFGGTTEAQPIFGGLGNVEFSHNDYDPPFDGLTLRLFDPESGLWRVWWASTRQPGQMGPPAQGRFIDGRAEFCAEEMLGDRMGRVRIVWTGLADGAPRWEQSFSYDDGRTWATNWVITSTRPS